MHRHAVKRLAGTPFKLGASRLRLNAGLGALRMMDMNTSGALLGQTAGTSMGYDDVVAGVLSGARVPQSRRWACLLPRPAPGAGRDVGSQALDQARRPVGLRLGRGGSLRGPRDCRSRRQGVAENRGEPRGDPRSWRRLWRRPCFQPACAVAAGPCPVPIRLAAVQRIVSRHGARRLAVAGGGYAAGRIDVPGRLGDAWQAGRRRSAVGRRRLTASTPLPRAPFLGKTRRYPENPPLPFPEPPCPRSDS